MGLVCAGVLAWDWPASGFLQGLVGEWILTVGTWIPPWHWSDPRYSHGIGQGRDPGTGLVAEWIPAWDWPAGVPPGSRGAAVRAQTVPFCATWGALPRSCGGGRGLRGHSHHRFGVPRGQGARGWPRGTAKPAGGWHPASPPALLPRTSRGANRATGPRRLGGAPQKSVTRASTAPRSRAEGQQQPHEASPPALPFLARGPAERLP